MKNWKITVKRKHKLTGVEEDKDVLILCDLVPHHAAAYGEYDTAVEVKQAFESRSNIANSDVRVTAWTVLPASKAEIAAYLAEQRQKEQSARVAAGQPAVAKRPPAKRPPTTKRASRRAERRGQRVPASAGR